MLMNGCRISQQLREYNPRQFGICCSTTSKRCRSCFNKAPPTPLSRPRKVPFCFSNRSSTKRFLGLKSFGRSALYTSSSSGAGNNDDLVGVSFINNTICAQDTSQAHVLSDYLSPAEDGGDPPSERLSPVAGGIVALGKFDALHIGHRELAIQAAKIGVPFLLSFVGMAEVLGWEPRAPVVAKCDRKRVLSSWAPLCCNVTPKEFELQFSQVRNLTPQQFVEKLSEELGVRGVVAGQNYRFGYRAAGNSSDLVRLCNEYGMRACIINSVMDKSQESREIGCGNSQEHGQVSSTRVRHALANGDMKYVSELLGRHHRLMLMAKGEEYLFRDMKRLSAPRSCFLNLPPKEGIYENCSLIIGDDNAVSCRVTIDTMDIHLELDELAPQLNITSRNLELLGIDFVNTEV